MVQKISYMNYPNQIISKFPNVKTTIFTIMSKLAQEHNAINLSQGFPDFSADKRLLDAVTNTMNKGQNQYAPMPGVMTLREKIAEKTESLYSAKYNPDTEITITAGATQAIFTAILSVVKEDDEVIIFEPAYDCYMPAIDLAGGKPVFIPLKFPDFTIDWDFVKKMINHRTRMIIINTPNNPSGTILNAADIQKLEKLITPLSSLFTHLKN